jgi:hypothetical protein
MDDKQEAVLGLGDARQCPSVTANAKVLSNASSHGVRLVAITHPAIWLTNM